MGKKVKIAWFGKHFGEEPPLTGNKKQGAGGIFFSGCNLRCVFCQNYQISQQGFRSKEYSIKEMAEIMLGLEADGALNIDLVSPTIWFSQIKEGICLAKKSGLLIPVVWNSNAYESESLLKEMEGLVDIYLPDFKYGDDVLAEKYSNAKNYSAVATKAIKEMRKQVGNLIIEQGIAKKGMIVRHLILPNNLENSVRVLKILSAIDKSVFLSIMSQYFPLDRVKDFPEINSYVSKKELQAVVDKALELGFQNGWIQEQCSAKNLVPDFIKKQPFSYEKSR